MPIKAQEKYHGTIAEYFDCIGSIPVKNVATYSNISADTVI